MKPHKHAELIKAWADGIQIQAKHISHLDWNDWHNRFMPNWDDDLYTYRIKPEPKPEPKKVTMYLYTTGITSKQLWLDKEPPETFGYRTISDYIGSIEVLK